MGMGHGSYDLMVHGTTTQRRSRCIWHLVRCADLARSPLLFLGSERHEKNENSDIVTTISIYLDTSLRVRPLLWTRCPLTSLV